MKIVLLIARHTRTVGIFPLSKIQKRLDGKSFSTEKTLVPSHWKQLPVPPKGMASRRSPPVCKDDSFAPKRFGDRSCWAKTDRQPFSTNKSEPILHVGFTTPTAWNTRASNLTVPHTISFGKPAFSPSGSSPPFRKKQPSAPTLLSRGRSDLIRFDLANEGTALRRQALTSP